MNTIKVKINRKDKNTKFLIDLTKCQYSYQLRQAFIQSLSLVGYQDDTINEVFNIQSDNKVCSEEIDCDNTKQ